MRAAIREVPPGRYSAEDFYDDCGRDTDPLRVFVTVIVEGDEITVDFDGIESADPVGHEQRVQLHLVLHVAYGEVGPRPADAAAECGNHAAHPGARAGGLAVQPASAGRGRRASRDAAAHRGRDPAGAGAGRFPSASSPPPRTGPTRSSRASIRGRGTALRLLRHHRGRDGRAPAQGRRGGGVRLVQSREHPGRGEREQLSDPDRAARADSRLGGAGEVPRELRAPQGHPLPRRAGLGVEPLRSASLSGRPGCSVVSPAALGRDGAESRDAEGEQDPALQGDLSARAAATSSACACRDRAATAIRGSAIPSRSRATSRSATSRSSRRARRMAWSIDPASGAVDAAATARLRNGE